MQLRVDRPAARLGSGIAPDSRCSAAVLSSRPCRRAGPLGRAMGNYAGSSDAAQNAAVEKCATRCRARRGATRAARARHVCLRAVRFFCRRAAPRAALSALRGRQTRTRTARVPCSRRAGARRWPWGAPGREWNAARRPGHARGRRVHPVGKAARSARRLGPCAHVGGARGAARAARAATGPPTPTALVTRVFWWPPNATRGIA